MICIYWLIIFQEHQEFKNTPKPQQNWCSVESKWKSLQWQKFFPLLIGSPTLPSWRTCVAKSQINGWIDYIENLYSPYETMETCSWSEFQLFLCSSEVTHWCWTENISTTQDCIEDYEFPQKEHFKTTGISFLTTSGDASLDNNQSHYDTSGNILGLKLVHRWTHIAWCDT